MATLERLLSMQSGQTCTAEIFLIMTASLRPITQHHSNHYIVIVGGAFQLLVFSALCFLTLMNRIDILQISQESSAWRRTVIQSTLLRGELVLDAK